MLVRPITSSRRFQLDQHDLGPCCHTHRWTPRSSAVGRVSLQIAQALQSIHNFSPDFVGDEVVGKELASMCVSGELKRNALFFCDWELYRCVEEKNAGAITINAGALEDLAVIVCVDRITIVNANQLQAFHFRLFVVQNAHSGPFQRRKIFGMAVKLFVVALDVIDSVGSRVASPRLGQMFEVCGRAVIDSACQENDVWLEGREFGDDPSDEATVSDVAEMKITGQSRDAATPLRR